MTDLQVGVVCGRCGGPVFMATCDSFQGTGHEWALMSACLLCRAVHWTEDGCKDCNALDSPAAEEPQP